MFSFAGRLCAAASSSFSSTESESLDVSESGEVMFLDVQNGNPSSASILPSSVENVEVSSSSLDEPQVHISVQF